MNSRSHAPFLPGTRPSLLFTAALALASRAQAEAATFVLASGESKVQFVSEAPLERITGATTRVMGQIELDPAAPEKVRAEIAVPVASIKTNNDLRDEHLRSDSWLDAGRFPNVQFALSSVSGVSTLPMDQSTSANLRGKLSVHGITRELATTAKVRLSQGSGRRTLRIQAQFPVALEAHKVSIPSLVKLKVAPVIQVNVDLYAHAPSTAATREQAAALPADAAVESSAVQPRSVTKPIPAPRGKSVAKSDAPAGDAGGSQLAAADDTRRQEHSDASQAEPSAGREAGGARDAAALAPPPAEPSAPAPSATPAATGEKTSPSSSREQGCSAVAGAHGRWPLLLAAAWLLRVRRRRRRHL